MYQMTQREREAFSELNGTGWPSVADEVGDGVPPEVILKRLYEIGEVESDAYEIVDRLASES